MRNDLVPFLLFLGTFTISTLKVMSDPGILAFHDLSPIWSPDQLFRPFDMPWDYKSNLGSPNLLLGNAIYNIPIIALSYLSGDVNVGHKLWLILIFTFTGYGFYKLFKGIFQSAAIGLVAGIYGIFNEWVINHLSLGHNLIILSYAVFPYLIDSYLRGWRTKKPLDVLLVGLLSALLLYISPHLGYIFCVFILIHTVVSSLLQERSLWRLLSNFRYTIAVIAVAFTAFLPMASLISGAGEDIYIVRIEDMSAYTLNLSEYLTSRPTSLSMLVPVAFIGVYIFRKKRFPVNGEEPLSLTITFAVMSTFGLILYAGVNLDLTVFLYKYLPAFYIFRELHKLLISGVYFVILALSITLKYLGSEVQRTRLLYILMALTVLAPSVSYTIISGDFSGSIDTVKIPGYYDKLYRSMMSEKEYFRIAFFPPAVWATRFNWSDHFFLDPAVSLQSKPTLQIRSEMDLTISANFVRWIYQTTNKWPIGKLGSLLGLMGVKYAILRDDVYMPPKRSDLSPFTKASAKSALRNANDLKTMERMGSLEIYEVQKSLPHIYVCDNVSIIVGDRRSLLSMLHLEVFDAATPPIFLDNLDTVDDIIDRTETVYIDPGRIHDLIIAFAEEKSIFKSWEMLPATARMDKEWIRGDYAWYMKEGLADVAPDGYAITESGKPLKIDIYLNASGTYLLFLQYFMIEHEDFNDVEVTLDRNYTEIIKQRGSPLGNYKWVTVGNFTLEKGYHEVKISTKEGTSAISKIALIPAVEHQKAKESLRDALKNKKLIYIIDDHTLSNSKYDAFIQGFNLSNGYAVKMDTEKSLPIFVPISMPFQIKVRAAGYGEITLSIDEKVEEFEVESEKMEEYVTDAFILDEGWKTLNLKSKGDVYLDFITLTSKGGPNSTSIRQPEVKMISGSRYQVSDVNSTFLVFLEGWNVAWKLKSGDVSVEPLIALGFANLFKIPQGTEGVMEIEFEGARIISNYSVLAAATLSLVTLTTFIVEFKAGADGSSKRKI